MFRWAVRLFVICPETAQSGTERQDEGIADNQRISRGRRMTYLIVKHIEDDKGYIKGYKTIRELVMCKDCALYEICPYKMINSEENGYCSLGKRREE